MIQKTLQTLNGKLQVAIPTTLHELQLGQLMAMQAAEQLNDLQAIHILSGVPLPALQHVKSFNELQVFNEHVLKLAHEIKALYNSEAIPKTVTFIIDGQPRKVAVLKNLSVEPAGAFMAARDIIAEEINKHISMYGEETWQQNFNPSLQTCSQVLAQYFYSPATGKGYDEQLAAEFTTEVNRMPVTDALPIARYFFLNYPNLSKQKTGFWHRLFRRWNNAQGSRNLKLFGTSTPLMPLPGAM